MKVETEGKQKGVPLHISGAVFGRKKNTTWRLVRRSKNAQILALSINTKLMKGTDCKELFLQRPAI